MKKLEKFFFFIIIFFIGLINVSAQDNVYSINKNDNEKFYYVIDTYNDKEEKDGNLLIGTFLKEEIELLINLKLDLTVFNALELFPFELSFEYNNSLLLFLFITFLLLSLFLLFFSFFGGFFKNVL